MTEKLRACPFCGSEDTERQRGEDGWLAVRCLNCGALGPCVDLTGTGCNAKWNARAQDMEQRAGFVMVPVKLTPEMIDAAERTPGIAAANDILAMHFVRTGTLKQAWPGDGTPLE